MPVAVTDSDSPVSGFVKEMWVNSSPESSAIPAQPGLLEGPPRICRVRGAVVWVRRETARALSRGFL